MALTVLKIEAAKPAEKDWKLYDSDGLYLLIKPKGHKWWRFKYRFCGKEKLLSLGTYPEVSLSDARISRNDARKLVAAGTDPSNQRKASKAALIPSPNGINVNNAAAAWVLFHRLNKPDKTSPLPVHITPEIQKSLDKLGVGMRWSTAYADRVAERMQRHVLKHIGELPLADIDSSNIAPVLSHLSPDIQHRIKRDLFRLFSFSKVMKWRDGKDNPATDLQEVLEKRPKRKNFAGIIDPVEFGGLLRSIDCYAGSFGVRTIMRLAPLLFQRPTELRLARWNEFDIKAGMWAIPAERMKSDEDHFVPLSRQAIEIIEAHRLISCTGPDGLLFPGERQRGTDVRPLSDVTVTAALANMGYHGRQTLHGFRASARTMAAERLKIEERFIELQLAHATKDPNGRAYDRAEFLQERRELMQLWADYLDLLRNSVGKDAGMISAAAGQALK
jgi:integrase